jgi:hypothetical protein
MKVYCTLLIELERRRFMQTSSEENETGFTSSIKIELGVICCKTLITAEHSL